MKFYIAKRKSEPFWDEFAAMVIAAPDIEKAKKMLLYSIIINCEYYEDFEIKELKQSDYSETELIIADFKAG